MRVQMPQLKPVYLPFQGGLNTTSQRLAVPVGMCQAAQNYEPGLQGGYRRLGGYERFDGRARPSDASYTLLENLTSFAAVANGVTVNGQTSGATGVVCDSDTNWIAVTQVVGTFAPGENIRNGVVVLGVHQAQGANFDAFRHNIIMAAAASVYRPAIQAPTGSGSTRVMALAGQVYAIRNNAGGTAAAVWRATTSGWTAVPLMREIAFTAGGTEYPVGSTLSKGGVTAIVRKAIVTTGSWGGTAAGRLIIDTVAGGEFTAGAAVGGGTCTLSGASTAITLLPNGELDYVTATFTNNQERIYACDGVNKPFEFDGTTLAPIDVPSAIRASCIEAGEATLYLGCGPEVFCSSTGDPFVYTVITGAAQLGAGTQVTDLLKVAGGAQSAMFVGTTRGPKVLYGDDKDTWQLTTLGSESGVQPRSARAIKGGLFFDDAGARSLASTQSWGNFAYGLESIAIDSWLTDKRVISSCLIPGRSLYRVWFSDGTGLSGAPAKNGLQWMPISYGLNVRQMVTHRINGVERVFFCDDSGMVFEADVGRSFDGAAIEAWLMLHAYTGGNVALQKTFRSGLLEASGESAFSIRVQSEFDDGDPDVALGDSVDARSGPVGMRWDVDRWDTGVWDGGGLASMRVGLRGNGASMAVAVYATSANELPHTLAGLNVLMTPRRLKR